MNKLLKTSNTGTRIEKRNINILNFLGLTTASQLQDIYSNEKAIHVVEKSIIENEEKKL